MQSKILPESMRKDNLARLLALIHQKRMQRQKHQDRRNQPIIVYVENEAEKFNSEEFSQQNYFDWLAPDTDKKEMKSVITIAEDAIDDMWQINPQDYEYGDVVRILSYSNGVADIYWEAENPEDAYHFPNGDYQILAELEGV